MVASARQLDRKNARSQVSGEGRSTRNGWAEVETKNRLQVGDTLEVMRLAGKRIVPARPLRNGDGDGDGDGEDIMAA